MLEIYYKRLQQVQEIGSLYILKSYEASVMIYRCKRVASIEARIINKIKNWGSINGSTDKRK